MKQFIFLLTSLVYCGISSSAQNPELLNNYQSVYVPQLTYGNGKTDIYDIRKTIVETLRSCGVPLFLDENEISPVAMKNPCTMIHCRIGNTSSSTANSTIIKILFFDCNNDTVLKFSGEAKVRSNFSETRNSFADGTRKALERFNDYHYQFFEAASSVPVIVSETSNDSIEWKAGRKLTWNDFKGKALDDDPADALTYTANETSFDAYGIGSRFNVESRVTCYFIKTHSWVKTAKESDYLLNHEQQHFNLAEAGAREFRMRIKKTEFKSDTFNKEIKKISTEVHDKYNKLQEQYDTETNHSRIEEKQKEWDVKIETMLKEMENGK